MGIGQNNPEWEKKIKEQGRQSKFRQHDQGRKAGGKKSEGMFTQINLKNEEVQDRGYWAVWTTGLRTC